MAKKFFSGFTLVELMIVVGIIAFLAVLAVIYFRGQIFKGNDARRKSDINRIQIAAEEYEKDKNCYPAFISCNSDSTQLVHPYLDKVPCDPVTKASYVYEPDGTSSCPRWYRIYSVLENQQDPQLIVGIGPNAAFNYYLGSPNAPVPAGAPGGTATGGGGAQESIFYGCKSGVLVPILWDPSIPGPECQPTFPSMGFSGACLDQNGNPQNECLPQ